MNLDHPLVNNIPLTFQRLAVASHETRRFREELDAARQGLEHFPDDWALLRYEIRALAAMGQMDAIPPLLAELEGMEPAGSGNPGNVLRALAVDVTRLGQAEDGQAMAERAIAWYQVRDPGGYLSGRARALLFLDQPDRALPLIRELLDQDPENMINRGLYGIALAGVGDSEGAEAEAAWFQKLDRPYLRGSNTRWRAAILAHLDRKDEAVSLLYQSLREGRSWMGLPSDPNFVPLWDYEPFERLIAPKR
jgi:tetratricopeptide (TPR) repeat protein